jgi:hypothetical protein
MVDQLTRGIVVPVIDHNDLKSIGTKRLPEYCPQASLQQDRPFEGRYND